MSINLEEIHAFLLSKSTGKTTIDTKTTVAVHAAVSAFIDKDTQGFSIIRSQLPSRVKKPSSLEFLQAYYNYLTELIDFVLDLRKKKENGQKK